MFIIIKWWQIDIETSLTLLLHSFQTAKKLSLIITRRYSRVRHVIASSPFALFIHCYSERANGVNQTGRIRAALNQPLTICQYQIFRARTQLYVFIFNFIRSPIGIELDWKIFFLFVFISTMLYVWLESSKTSLFLWQLVIDPNALIVHKAFQYRLI